VLAKESYLSNMNEINFLKTNNEKFLFNTINEGDGLELLRNLPNNSVQLVIFDPQYRNIDEVAPINSKRIKIPFHSQPLYDQSQMDITTFFKEIERVLKPSGFVILWIDDNILIKTTFKQWITTNLKIKEILIWVKKRFLALGWNKFRKQCEYALLIQKRPFKRLENIQKENRSIGNVFNEFVKINNRHHTHQKPLEMTKTIIQQLTQEEDLIVDPCAGSFVSLSACQELKRNFLGTDLTFRQLMQFNINKKRSRELLKQIK